MTGTSKFEALPETLCRMDGASPCGLRVALRAVLLMIPLLLFAARADGQGGSDIVGAIAYHRIKGTETLLEIARLHDLGYVELLAANPGIDPWVPEPGRTLLLPTAHLLPSAPREGIVINLSEFRLYYFPDESGAAVTYPIGIGREGWDTPTGTTRISRKREAPTWIPPRSIREARPDLPPIVPPGPNNPLGDYALDLGWPSYVIHGTNKPYGIGRRVSSGCIRLYPEDILTLFESAAVGTRVTVVDQPLKVGWSGGELYIEVHPDTDQADQLETTGKFAAAQLPGYADLVTAAAGEDASRIVWPIVERAIETRRGIPIRITQ